MGKPITLRLSKESHMPAVAGKWARTPDGGFIAVYTEEELKLAMSIVAPLPPENREIKTHRGPPVCVKCGSVSIAEIPMTDAEWESWVCESCLRPKRRRRR
jgi:hypothetical protein